MFADDSLQLTDLHTVPENPGEPARLARLKNLQPRTCAGEWLTGVDATARARSHTRRGLLFRVLRWTLVGRLAEASRCYWVRKRYQNRYGCSRCAGKDWSVL
jgi:hypothetical protein